MPLPVGCAAACAGASSGRSSVSSTQHLQGWHLGPVMGFQWGYGSLGKGSSAWLFASLAVCCAPFRPLQQWAGNPLILSPVQNTDCLT